MPDTLDNRWDLSVEGGFHVPATMTHLEFMDKLCAYLESIGAAFSGVTRPITEEDEAAAAEEVKILAEKLLRREEV